jgi:hypothetical protein
MAENEEITDDGGSLADAIAAHIALKKEHGADATELEAELEDAMAPPTREPGPAPNEQPPEAETPPIEVPPDTEPLEPEEPIEPPSAPEPPAPDPEPVAAEPEPESESEPQTETTGTIEFEWDKPDSEPDSPTESVLPEEQQHDLLEDTPDFFEETPEHDKLWFDEAPPRKFEF